MEHKINDVLKFQEISRDSNTDWKRIGLELKLQEIIESLEQLDFESPATLDYLHELTEKLTPFIDNLSIEKLQTRKYFKQNPVNPTARVVNVPTDECFRGSLEFIGRLSNLKSLSIRFDPGFDGHNYERRIFQIAVSDIDNVSKALKKLEKLEDFSIRRTDLRDAMKIFHLSQSLSLLENLRVLDLSFCSITSKSSGMSFEELLVKAHSMKSLEMRGNDFDFDFCHHFARGLSNFKGTFDYLGLSLNPVLGKGLDQILQSIADKNNVIHLDISNCDDQGKKKSPESLQAIQVLIGLVSREGNVREMKINGNEIESQRDRNDFIKALEMNCLIDGVHCDECGELG